MTVVTRFAPSPTGYLHIGGARTALFCWLYARHTGGKFLLRIEDTDLERSTQAAVDALLDGLSWLGLAGDEPPIYQSQRADRHREAALELVERGAAYRSYETEDELDELRDTVEKERDQRNTWEKLLANMQTRLAKQLDQPFDATAIGQLASAKLAGSAPNQLLIEQIQTNTELHKWVAQERQINQTLLKSLNKAFRSRYRDGRLPPPSPNAPYVVRLRMPDQKELEVNDRVQGLTRLAIEDLDDFILLRSDGTPTYMLAVVVDDHDMGVTHVIRGDDHFINTFRQAPIFMGMNWPVPTYAHLPLIHDEDGSKLSKRHGAAGVDTYRDELGYLPEGLTSYLLRLGWSHGNDEIVSKEQAATWFDLDHLNKSPARLDFAKLDFINKHYMAQADDQRLYDLFLARPEAKDLSQDALARIRAAMPVLKMRSPNLVAMVDQARFLTDIRPISLSGKAKDLVNEEARGRIADFVARLEKLGDWTEGTIKEELTQYCAQIGIGLGKIGPVLRAVLTGGTPSPDIALVLALLGRNESVARMKDHASDRG